MKCVVTTAAKQILNNARSHGSALSIVSPTAGSAIVEKGSTSNVVITFSLPEKQGALSLQDALAALLHSEVRIRH